jgi:hypothetical protein
MATDTAMQIAGKILGEFEVLAVFPPFNENSVCRGKTSGFKSAQVC